MPEGLDRVLDRDEHVGLAAMLNRQPEGIPIGRMVVDEQQRAGR